MDHFKIFKQTLPFVAAKLILGICTFSATVVVAIIICWLGKSMGLIGLWMSICVWLAVAVAINWIANHYVGYLLKAGHIAVLVETYLTGKVPENQIQTGIDFAKNRFKTVNAYFIVNELVQGAVMQINKKVGFLNTFSVPGIQILVMAMQSFVNIFLNYIDECCLSWTFVNYNQSKFESAADGIVLYVQNWKELAKNALKIVVGVVGLTMVCALVIFVPVCLMGTVVGVPLLYSILASLLLAYICKSAVVDSFIVTGVILEYLDVAMESELSFDLYEKLCEISSKFKELTSKREAELVETAWREQ